MSESASVESRAAEFVGGVASGRGVCPGRGEMPSTRPSVASRSRRSMAEGYWCLLAAKVLSEGVMVWMGIFSSSSSDSHRSGEWT